MNDKSLTARGQNLGQAAAKELAILSAINQTEESIRSTISIVNELTSRLQCVSRTEPACDSEKSPVEPMANTVQDSIKKFGRDINSINYRLQELLRLLEV